MYLKKTPTKKGRISLSAVHGFRDNNGRVRQRTIKTFGYVDELAKKYEDPIAHFTEVVSEMDKQRLATQGPQTIEIHPLQKVDKRTQNRKYVGDAVSLAYYNALGIEQAVRSGMRYKKAKFDCNAILRLLVMQRLLDPCSKRAALSHADKHFFKSDFSDNDVYRSLDEFARLSDSIISKMNSTIAKSGIRDLSCGYYDCTNYYFESDEDDFRKKGVSKEHRPNPIVQMGLMQDDFGIPVSFNLYAGNTHDSDTLIDALPKAKKAADMKRVVTVADKGMNSSRNIIATILRGDGFVFSQSIRGTKSSANLRKWVVCDNDYVIFDGGEFKMKARYDTKTVRVSKEESHDGHSHKIDVPVLIVAFWSRKHAQRARHEREKVLQKANKIIKSKGLYTKATNIGAAKYVNNIEIDANTGEILHNKNKMEIDWEKVKKDEECDGYYCIITSEVNWEPKKVIEKYRELWKIEETFKVTKSFLKARPVFVWTKNRIKAHFLTCYIALTIERIIEHALGHKYCAGQILQDMRQVMCSSINEEWWLFDYRSNLTDELFRLIGEDSPRKYMRKSDIKALLNKGKKVLWQMK